MTTSLLDFSSDEAGAMLGMSAGAVRTYASRGRTALKGMMERGS